MLDKPLDDFIAERELLKKSNLDPDDGTGSIPDI
jgi:hypothetical protein